ncbi:hypothetical protein TrCOL_g212 [Triparma columacea]|uniref:Uncharacterized protein n=1 Tax=Triparma columacea TaxID=722753 RepID=A0A9W7LCB9_9STRA|nr:hypothetical protein TrCOL_g212 [Triparma columacea]
MVGGMGGGEAWALGGVRLGVQAPLKGVGGGRIFSILRAGDSADKPRPRRRRRERRRLRMAVNRSAGRVSKAIGEEYVGRDSKGGLLGRDGGKRRVSVVASRRCKFEVKEEFRVGFREYVEMDVQSMKSYRERWGLSEIPGSEGRYRSTLPLLPILGLDLSPTIDFTLPPPSTPGVRQSQLRRTLTTSRVDLLSGREGGRKRGEGKWGETVTVLDTLARYSDPKVKLKLEVDYPREGEVREYYIWARCEFGFDVPGRYGGVKVEVVKGIVKRLLGIAVKEGVKRCGKVVEGDLEVWEGKERTRNF